jgi:integrase
VLVDQNIDPRDQKLEVSDAAELARAERRRQQLTVGDVWPLYLEQRYPENGKKHWSKKTYTNHVKFAHAGGVAKKRGKGLTIPGALHELMSVRLVDLSADRMIKWIEANRETRGTNTILCFDYVRAFANWTGELKEYKGLIDLTVFTQKLVKEQLPKRKAAKSYILQPETLMQWFISVHHLSQMSSTCLIALLLTGARKEEMTKVKWEDVNFDAMEMTIRDKDESKGGEDGKRTIPLTPYLGSLIAAMPRVERNPYVFASPRAAEGFFSEPGQALEEACKAASLPHITCHGLRKSFSTLPEWIEGIPAGIVAQIMGHKPSATAEKHYKVRSISLLRHWHMKIEQWFLEQAGVKFQYPEDRLRHLKLAA